MYNAFYVNFYLLYWFLCFYVLSVLELIKLKDCVFYIFLSCLSYKIKQKKFDSANVLCDNIFR